jgi:hypothetical protein
LKCRSVNFASTIASSPQVPTPVTG